MEYEKIINLVDNTSNQPSKFRTKTWVELNNDARGNNRQCKRFKCCDTNV